MIEQRKPCICEIIFKCYYCFANNVRVDCHTYYAFCKSCDTSYIFMTGEEYMERIQDERIRWKQVGDEFKHSAHHAWSGDDEDDLKVMEHKASQICKTCGLTSTNRKMEVEDGINSICIWCVRKEKKDE